MFLLCLLHTYAWSRVQLIESVIVVTFLKIAAVCGTWKVRLVIENVKDSVRFLCQQVNY